MTDRLVAELTAAVARYGELLERARLRGVDGLTSEERDGLRRFLDAGHQLSVVLALLAADDDADVVRRLMGLGPGGTA